MSEFKFPDYLDQHQIETSELPEKVQSKIDTFDQTYDQYAESEEESREEEELLAKLKALDNGIMSDIQSHLAQKQKETPKANDGGQTASPSADGASSSNDQAQSDSSSPSWRFWM